MRSLICAFVVRIWHKKHFRMTWPNFVLQRMQFQTKIQINCQKYYLTAKKSCWSFRTINMFVLHITVFFFSGILYSCIRSWSWQYEVRQSKMYPVWCRLRTHKFRYRPWKPMIAAFKLTRSFNGFSANFLLKIRNLYEAESYFGVFGLMPVYILWDYLDRVKRIWYLSPMRAAKVQASLRIRAVSPEPPLLAHTSSKSSGTFRLKARSLAPLNGWACAVTICHDGMLEDTNSLDAAHFFIGII